MTKKAEFMRHDYPFLLNEKLTKKPIWLLCEKSKNMIPSEKPGMRGAGFPDYQNL
jgi:hypothetical protein